VESCELSSLTGELLGVFGVKSKEMVEIKPAITAIGGLQIDAIRRLKFLELVGTAMVTRSENLRMTYNDKDYTVSVDSVEELGEGLSLVAVTVF
jgi:adenylate cyclase class IV